MGIVRDVLWIDCCAAAAGGVVVLLLGPWLSRLHGLPQAVLVFIGLVSLLYAAGGYLLARRPLRPVALIAVMACANGLWALVCLAIVVRFFDRISIWGMIHLFGEALFVTGLARVEWNQRHRLAAVRRQLTP